MYAETDLDQPIDYSLRYAEDDTDTSDTDECNKINKTNTTNEFIQDTIKTYCTEDTPYETPFNFSTATSLSDLRIDDKSIEKLDNNETKTTATTTTGNATTTVVAAATTTTTTTTTTVVVKNESKIVKSGFSSGLISPEKPINYCEEGTPGYFSREPSLNSLNSIAINEIESSTIKPEQKNNETKINKETKRNNNNNSNNNEVKAVKFEEVVNYAEETPLMFSRSSSLASLYSIDDVQHSIHDDRSSIISDFSRLTSGLVSPSELPDSPTQTIPPPSPKLRQIKQQNNENSTNNGGGVVETPTKINVFEDTVKKFKLESTPIQFSRATSLSSLTIDEHDGHNQQIVEEDQQSQQQQQQHEEIGHEEDVQNIPQVEEVEEKQPPEVDEEVVIIDEKLEENRESKIIEQKLEKLNLNDDGGGDNSSSESGEEDEDMLAACINIGIQKNRYSQQKSNRSSPELPTYNYPKNNLNWLKENGKNNNVASQSAPLGTDLGNSSISDDTLSLSSSSLSSTTSEAGEAALLEECILAGMPTKRSNVPPSNSLSIKSNELTEAEQALLQQCILDGMKKSRFSSKKQFNHHHKIKNDLTESERSLLQQCIMAGMQKNNNNKNNNNSNRHHHRPSTSKDNELTLVERQMLEQCILEGMPKAANRSLNSNNNNNNSNNNRSINVRRFRDYDRLNQTTTGTIEHTCCIHCPRNQQKQLMLRQNNHLRMKRKNRNHERSTTQIHIRENKDINILYVTSQILALKKEMIDRSHEEWV